MKQFSHKIRHEQFSHILQPGIRISDVTVYFWNRF